MSTIRVKGGSSNHRKNQNKRSKDEVDHVTKQQVRNMITSLRTSSPKYFDVNVSAQNQGSGGNVGSLSLVPQGVTQSSRVADSLLASHFHMRWTTTTQNADVTNNLRVIIFIWKPSTTGAAPTLASILPDTAVVGYQSQLNWPLRDQYRVLMDRTFAMSGIATAPTVSGNWFWSFSCKLKLRMEFGAAVTTGTNQVWVCSISDSAAVPFPIATYSSRLIFEDEE